MGLSDRDLKVKHTAPPPPPSTSEVRITSLPAPGKIESYEIADAVGLLRLEGGDRVRFGRSACKGFEPVVGASVILEELASYPRGWRAKTVRLDPSDDQYDSLLSARDKELGLPNRTMGNDEAAAAARQLAVITVLLKDPLPEGTQALRVWAAKRGFPREGIAVETERDLKFSMARGLVLTYPGRCTLPKEGLDVRNLPKDFDFGQAFLGLGVGLPGADRQVRMALTGTPDCWAKEGNLRQLCRLVRVLADQATGVVIHRAGDLVVPLEEFVRMLGDLEDPDCRPFGAWLDVGITTKGDEKVYRTFGMDAFGMLDVVAPVDANDRWSRSRRHEAVLYACYRMVRENQELTAGESLRVPLRLNIGAWPVEIEGKEAAFTYAIREDDGLIKLVPIEETDPAKEWQEQSTIAVNAYQSLFDRGLAEALPSDLVRDVASSNPAVVQHSIEVRARHDGKGFLLVTNGFGRGSQGAGASHQEVAAWVPTHSLELIRLVGVLASAASSLATWKPGDLVESPTTEFGIAGFALAEGPIVDMGGGPKVAVLLLVPFAEQEFKQLREGSPLEWLSQNEVSERRWVPFLTS